MSPRSSSLLALGLATGALAVTGPCDIYASGNTSCVAAHSTTRALYGAYTGALYQVKRDSDGNTTDIAPLSAGGVANASAQDAFCASTTCLITIIYDQSGNKNHLTEAPPGGEASGPQGSGYDNLASAIGAPVTLDGKKAYGVFISPETGYRNDATNRIATGDAEEGMYAVFDGTHYNGACCFDYGNAETNNHDTGNGHMEALYFGTNTYWGTGADNGPWVMADLENGLFSGQTLKKDTNDSTVTYRFLSATLKGGANKWTMKAGDAATGGLSTFYSGARSTDSGYNPMHKEGAIVLGIGGDNSNGAQGTFYEGVMTTGYPSDETENAVQANIVAAKYAVSSLVSGPTIEVGSNVTIRVTTPGSDTRYLAHDGETVNTQVINSSSSAAAQAQGQWTVRTGLANSGCISFESKDTPGSYIRHYNFVLELQAGDNTKQFKEDATFCPQTGLSGSKTNSIRSWAYPTRFFRHYNNIGYIATNGGPEDFDSATLYNNDASFVVGTGF